MDNYLILGEHQDNTLEQFHEARKDAVYSALMSDGHLGYDIPIGGVMAYRDQVSVSGVGFDIACGNLAIKTDIVWEELAPFRNTLANDINNVIGKGTGVPNPCVDGPFDEPLFESDAWDIIPQDIRDPLKAKARNQLGSIGSGNHYVDLLEDQADGRLWIAVHFGSRGLGHTIASNFYTLAAGGNWGERTREKATLLDTKSQLGQDYLALMHLAGEYAYAGREWVVFKIASDILGARETKYVHNHHNYAWREKHHDEYLWVVRKGATPAFPGQWGFVGGSMCDTSVVLEGAASGMITGKGTELQRAALFSTVHGAGRVMSRKKAKKSITRDEMSHMANAYGVTLRGAGPDESPWVYRKLHDVLTSQKDTIRVLHRMKPKIVIMA